MATTATTKRSRCIRVGWFAFDGGFGRPFEGWRQHEGGSWQVAGRAFTRKGAHRKAMRLPALRPPASLNITIEADTSALVAAADTVLGHVRSVEGNTAIVDLGKPRPSA